MKYFKSMAIFTVLICALMPGVVLAQNAQTGDLLVTCDKNGLNQGGTFTSADITLSGIEDLGNYTYLGVDAGVFKKVSDTQWQCIYVERLLTNGLTIRIGSFGPITAYEYEAVYSIGYRIVYRVSSGPENPIIETQWKQVKKDGNNIYFKAVTAYTPVTENDVAFTDRVTEANKWMSDAEAAIYNKYFLGDEVVCRLVITPPAGADIDAYKININTNADKTDIYETDYIKVVKISVGNTVYRNENPKAGDLPLKQNAGSEDMDITINSPGTETVNVYYKFKFRKVTDANLAAPELRQFTSKAEIIPVVSGTNQDAVEKTLTIYTRGDAKAQIM